MAKVDIENQSDALGILGDKLDQIIELLTPADHKPKPQPCSLCLQVGPHQPMCPRYVDPVLGRAVCSDCGSLFGHRPGCGLDATTKI